MLTGEYITAETVIDRLRLKREGPTQVKDRAFSTRKERVCPSRDAALPYTAQPFGLHWPPERLARPSVTAPSPSDLSLPDLLLLLKNSPEGEKEEREYVEGCGGWDEGSDHG